MPVIRPRTRPSRPAGEREPLVRVTAKLLAINRVISKLDPSIRSVAFQILAPYYLGSAYPGAVVENRLGAATPGVAGNRGIRDVTPGDNVLACVALLYAQRGATPVTEEEVRQVARRCGLRMPHSPNNTLRYARRRGKAMFRFRDGGWSLTQAGVSYLQLVYGVLPRARTATAKRAA